MQVYFLHILDSPRSWTLNASKSVFVSGTLHQLFTMAIEVIAYPENVNFTWRKGDILNTDLNYIIRNGHLSTTLTIRNFTYKHTGSYFLNMENGIGKGSVYKFHVLLKGQI